MYSQQSPIKRKHSEFHDPDYPQDQLLVHHDGGSHGENAFAKMHKPVDEGGGTQNTSKDLALKVKEVVEKEFTRELELKKQQLVVIDDRISQVRTCMEKLRYSLVSSYYQKQDLNSTALDSAAFKEMQPLFSREDKGPQMQIHPSIKKLIGKKPKDLSDVLRTCPKRTAAQNAVQVIREKSEVHRREERKLKQIIRGQGIVIDHSIEKETKTDLSNLLNAAQKTKSLGTPSAPSKGQMAEASQPLVKSRLNNKVKHLIVVGNTSKSIVAEQERDLNNHAQALTHKWLVYVQSKESSIPIERFVKKVRFHLHHSYRPNDIVDVQSPPFHVARRGWGEFPVRVQLYFHQEYHQKPVQLVHNVVLDKTMSGLQTLGAETLVEVWLRNVTAKQPGLPKEEIKTTDQPKNRSISGSEDFVDENLLEFLNKIEATHCSISADIEKIQPTVMVSEAVPVKSISPTKTERTCVKSPDKVANSALEIIPDRTGAACVPYKTGKCPDKIDNSTLGIIPEHADAVCVSQKLGKSPDKVANSTFGIPDQSGAECAPEKPANSSPNIQCVEGLTDKTSGIEPFHKYTKEISKPTHPSEMSHSAINNTTAIVHDTMDSLTTAAEALTCLKQPVIGLQQAPVISQANAIPSANTTQIPQNQPNFPLNATAKPISVVKPTVASVILNKDGKIIMPLSSVASAVQRTILPVVSSIAQNSVKSSPAISSPNIFALNNNAPKPVLQKKLVQVVDASGKVRYMQMLVASPCSTTLPSATATRIPQSSGAQRAPNLTPLVRTIAPSLKPGTTTTQMLPATIPTPAIKIANGPNVSLNVASVNMKPNIFKLVPENVQTKPQILTFSTAVTKTITTNSTVTSTAFTPPVDRCAAALLELNSIASKIRQKTSSSMPRNVVFQKEGKVYIIDPLQTKLKQQQKKQVSLLKPQISLLKQQIQQQKSPTKSSFAQPFDHQYIQVCGTPSTTNHKAAQLHYGPKQQRQNSLNALQLMQMKRVLFEKQFLKQNFTRIRFAIEFLLRRLRLVAPPESIVAAFPFVTSNHEKFQSLTAFKQRSFEWLRAKHVSRLIRAHADLKKLSASGQDTFWTTKEIAHFARQFAYTPDIKSLPKLVHRAKDCGHDFKDLVKDELTQKPCVPYETLTRNTMIEAWIGKVWPVMQNYELVEDQDQVIDINTVAQCSDLERQGHLKNRLSRVKQHSGSSAHDEYLPPPAKLDNECSIVSEICRDLNITLAPEELVPNVWHTSAQTVLSQCLHIFVQKIVRAALAMKNQHSEGHATEATTVIKPSDIFEVLSKTAEFDFLTNRHLGSAAAVADTAETIVKRERP